MEAALALAARGDASHLPRRTDQASEADLARALCMLVHDTDGERQLARYREFLPPRGRVTVSEQLENDFADRDENGDRVDESPKDEHFTRKGLGSFNLHDAFGAGAFPKCDGEACKVDTSDGWYGVIFKAGKDGRTYLSEIHRYRWHGCPC
jgi:hypothetical protein